MANKPVTGLTVFGASTSGTTTQLDNNFAALQNAANDFNTYANYLIDTGVANAYVVTLGASLTGALTDGLVIQMKAVNSNTAAATLNYNGGGSIAIVNPDNTPIVAGQIAGGGIYQLQYQSAYGAWVLQTPYVKGWRLISRQAANANVTVDFNASLNSTFDQYQLVITDLVAEKDGAAISLLVGNGNASAANYQVTNYDWSGMLTGPNANANSTFIGSTSNSAATAFPLTATTSTLGNAVAETLSATVKVQGPAVGRYTDVVVESTYSFTDGTSRRVAAGGYWSSNSPVTSLQVKANTGNISSGNFALYGLVKI